MKLPLVVFGAFALMSVGRVGAEVVISGAVIDQNELPVAGAELVFRNQVTASTFVAASTNASGDYSVNLGPVVAPTLVGYVSWGQVKRSPVRKSVGVRVDTTFPALFSVTISHEQVEPFAADSLVVPADRRMDFQVERIVAAPEDNPQGGTAEEVADPLWMDDFNDNVLDGDKWTAFVSEGADGSVQEVDGRLRIRLGGGSQKAPSYRLDATSRWVFRGDFDIQVDYRLDAWPPGNHVRVGLKAGGIKKAGYLDSIERVNDRSWGDVYLTHFSDGAPDKVVTPDTSGRLRLTRMGQSITGYFFKQGEWVAIHTGPAATEDGPVLLGVWADEPTSGATVSFDNFAVNAGTLVETDVAPHPPERWLPFQSAATEEPTGDNDLIEIASIELNGAYLAGLSVAAPSTRLAVGETLVIHFVGRGLSQVKQIEFQVDVLSNALDIGGARFHAQAPFRAPGDLVDISASPTLRFGGASFGGDVSAAEFDFGELVLPTSAPVTQWDIQLRSISVGSSSEDRDLYDDLHINLPIVVEIGVKD